MIEVKNITPSISGYLLTVRDEEDRSEIGSAFLYILRNNLHERNFGFVENVHIISEKQRKGNGKKLCQMIIDEAKKMDCYKLILNVREENTIAKSLYEKMGFIQHDLGYRMNF